MAELDALEADLWVAALTVEDGERHAPGFLVHRFRLADVLNFDTRILLEPLVYGNLHFIGVGNGEDLGFHDGRDA